LDEDGGAQEPHETEPAGDAPDGTFPAGPATPDDRPRRLLLIGGVIAAVGVIAAIAFTVGGGGDFGSPPPDDDLEITLPDASTSSPPLDTTTTTTTTTTRVPRTTVARTTTVPSTAPPTTARSTVPATTAAGRTTGPSTTDAGRPTTPTSVTPSAAVSIESIVPDIAASRRDLATPDQVQNLIDRLLQRGGRHDVALSGDVSTLCATVTLKGPIDLSGRWERDGEKIDETGLVLRTAPGFGDCIDNDGSPLEPGSYQYIATDDEGTDSSVANFVVGAERIDQQFVNNGEEPVCAILVAPTTSDYFEDYVFSTPMAPKASVMIPIAEVSQDVEVWGCSSGADEGAAGDGGPDTLADFGFDPTPGQQQPLIP
jgi:hypothetical protein